MGVKKSHRAVIYTRVSTDEQADRGFSLRDQESRLRQHCRRQAIEVVGHYQDDASAKTFDRPAWKELMLYAEAHSADIDAVLFVKWDRFSRDATGALSMIRALENLAIEPQAVEQPIDWTVPEQLMLLAIYVAAPQVENQRRSINTIMGMRRAMREGRYCNVAPVGYSYARDERDKSILQPNDRAEQIIVAFEMAAANPELPIEEIRRRVNKLFKKQITRSRFPELLRNPLYAGKVVLPAWRDEPEEIIEGIHEGLVSESIFYKVQDRFLETSQPDKKIKLKPELFLRGHLLCTSCGELLTGSSSKGRNRYYAYYHCHHCAKTRYRAEAANEAFLNYLSSCQIAPEVQTLYSHILSDLTRSEKDTRSRQMMQLKTKISALEEKLLKTDEMYIEGNIEKDSYIRLKSKYKEDLIEKRIGLQRLEDIHESFAEQLKFAVGLLSNLGRIFKEASLQLKNDLLVRIYPDKLIYSDESFRTSPESPIIALISGKTHKKEKRIAANQLPVPVGSPGRTRTYNPAVNSRMLYH